MKILLKLLKKAYALHVLTHSESGLVASNQIAHSPLSMRFFCAHLSVIRLLWFGLVRTLHSVQVSYLTCRPTPLLPNRLHLVVKLSINQIGVSHD